MLHGPPNLAIVFFIHAIRTKKGSGGFIYVCMHVFSQRTFQEICKGVHMQKNQEQQLKKSPTSMYQYPPPSVHPRLSLKSVCLCATEMCLKNMASMIWYQRIIVRLYQQVLQLWFELCNKNSSNHIETSCMLKPFTLFPLKRITFSLSEKHPTSVVTCTC